MRTISRGRIMKCNCYVQHLDEGQRYVMRYGAHTLDCPVYRKSGDLLDNRRDENIRKFHTGS